MPKTSFTYHKGYCVAQKEGQQQPFRRCIKAKFLKKADG